MSSIWKIQKYLKRGRYVKVDFDYHLSLSKKKDGWTMVNARLSLLFLNVHIRVTIVSKKYVCTLMSLSLSRLNSKRILIALNFLYQCVNIKKNRRKIIIIIHWWLYSNVRYINKCDEWLIRSILSLFIINTTAPGAKIFNFSYFFQLFLINFMITIVTSPSLFQTYVV